MSQYAETNALASVMDGDKEELDRILSGFLPGELSDLAVNCATLEQACYRKRSEIEAAL